MSGFSAAWLLLREAADHRSRNKALAGRLEAHFRGAGAVRVVDLGCGTGSNLRATWPLLGEEQHWTLIDFDAGLLAAARETLARWAGPHERVGDDLMIVKCGKRIRAAFRQADLSVDLERALGERPDLVTASAFFDLCSGAFMKRFAEAVAARRAAFYTVLTYNGQQSWTPAHAADAAMLHFFRAHQESDKGFGPSAGWAAPGRLQSLFADQDYAVTEGDSPWVLGPVDRALIRELAAGFAHAVGETDHVPADTIAAWLAVERTEAVVGHTDTLALPGPAA